MQGAPLRETVISDKPVRTAALFGIFGGHINVTDGRYVYMRAPISDANTPLYEYTLMPTHMRESFQPNEFRDVALADPFSFTKDCKTMKTPSLSRAGKRAVAYHFGTMLFDLKNDPRQEKPIKDHAVEEMMKKHLVRLMKENDAPPEQFERLGLT
jgi:hypothetical protein